MSGRPGSGRLAMLDELVAISRRFGGDPAWVLAGGGNTSYKDAETMWVKASGTALATIGSEGFCAMDRARLDAIWTKAYPAEAEAREAAALADLMAARVPGETRRPSVETLLHGFFPQAFVVHTHPALANGLGCGRRGREAFDELFSDEGIWIPLVEPGYILAKRVRGHFEAFRELKGRVPSLLFLQNHGILVAGDTTRQIEELSSSIAARIESRVSRRPKRGPATIDPVDLAACLTRLRSLAQEGDSFAYRADPDILGFAEDEGAFAPIAAPFSPDHIVYAGSRFARANGTEDLDRVWKDFAAETGGSPRILVVAGLGAFSIGDTRAKAESALALFIDACAVAVYAESFGGALHMPSSMVDFIRNWEVERYRSKTNADEEAKG